MDRNQTIGLLLISAILLVYVFFFAPKPPETSYQNPKTDSKAVISKREKEALNTQGTDAISDSLLQVKNRAQLGTFAQDAITAPKTFTLENNLLQVKINSKGGQLSKVWLKKFKTYDKKPLLLLDSASSKISLLITTTEGKKVDLRELNYTVKPGTYQPNSLHLIAPIGNNQQVEQVYTLAPDQYTVSYSVNMGEAGQLVNAPAKLVWVQLIKRNEFDLEQSRARTTTHYYTADESFNKISPSSKLEEAIVDEPVKWFGHKEKFFTSGLNAAKPFAKATFRTNVNLADSSIMKSMQSEVIIPADQLQNGALSFTFFFGPNDHKVLSSIGDNFNKNLELGWGPLAWVNKLLIINIFNFLGKYISNFGVIIILLVLIIKTILFPLTYKSYTSMAKMRVLKPELDLIKEQSGGDMQKSQQETMKLYSKMGVNPVSGCIPVLLSLPVLLAMFNFFPNAIELRQEHFLWANDLSTYDVFARLPFTIPFYGSHISMFTLLMTASTILYTWSNNQVSTMQGPMVFMSYVMPLVFMFVLNSFPAGLSFYYFVSNIVTFGQQAAIRAFVDEKKIRATLEANVEKNKNKKTTSFQQRIEQAMRAAQERNAEAKPKAGRKK